MADIFLQVLLFILAAAGIALCLIWGLPKYERFCTEDCKSLKETGAAHVFGFKNWQAGLGFYGIVAIAALTSSMWIVFAAFVGSVIALFVSVGLFAALVTRYKVFCLTCYAAHLINLLIFSIFIIELLRAS
jgi:uncharacterized membrane protein